MTWAEYAFVRVGVQLRKLAETRKLTADEQRLLDLCQETTDTVQARESKAPLVKSANQP